MSLQQARDADFGEWREAMLAWKQKCESDLSLRDQFAAAALTGLLAHQHGYYGDDIDEPAGDAYAYADAMLRERGKAFRDNCPSGNNSEVPCPVTEPMPKEKRAEVSDGSEPVAWAIERADGGSLMGFCHTKREAARFAHAIIEDTKSEHYALRTVPLYRHPQPTLTDAESLARLFHAEYERRSAEYDYKTRPDTRQFDPSSANGRLMVAVCRAVLEQLAPQPTLTDAEREAVEVAAEFFGLRPAGHVATTLRGLLERLK